MRILLLQLDGSLPNVALMRLAAHHRGLGDNVELRRVGNAAAVQPELGTQPDRVYASLIFERTKPVARALLQARPDAVVGGTGWDLATTLESVGVETLEQDYTVYPTFRRSIGFTQRGCRLKCPFCVVPRKEGPIRQEQTVAELWRGEPWPRQLHLLDNDFFGQPAWRERIAEIREGDFEVSFTQGINARVLDDDVAVAVASVKYRDDAMRRRRIYTAWDSKGDERRLFAGLHRLVAAGVAPSSIMVYMLIGYWPNETHDDREHRRTRLREFGADPYPMPFARTPELVAYQRWVIGHYDKKIPWEAWIAARGEPRRLRMLPTDQMELIGDDA